MSIEEIYEIFVKHPHISTDSRKIEKGCLFFALKGDNFNGNKFAQNAIRDGAAFAVIDEEAYAGDQTILVNNVLDTLQELARFHRSQLNIPILGITGTNGKTTTKELISAVLAKKYKLAFTQGNLNNHIGVPLTLLSMDKDTEFGVVEMGANHPGEIDELCRIAHPGFGIITNIGRAHLEGFGSFEGVIKTKGELYRYIDSKKGVIFYNSDNLILEEIGKQLSNRVSFGSKDAELTGEPVQSPPFIHVKANFTKGILYLNSNLIGDFNYENILAAACIGNYFGVDPLKIQEAIKNYQPKNNRSQLIKKGGLKIIMDAYNANPTSMSASIKSFLNNLSGKNYMILGDMLEMGEYAADEHKKILDLIPEQHRSATFLVGEEFVKAAENRSFKTFNNISELAAYISKSPIKKGNILIKGSRGIQLEKILDVLN